MKAEKSPDRRCRGRIYWLAIRTRDAGSLSGHSCHFRFGGVPIDMRKTIALLFLSLPLYAFSQNQKPPTTLRGVLLEQLHTTHDVKDWFVPIDVAVAGLTPEQVNWTDGHGNHSIGQLTYHLLYWDKRALEKFKGEPLEKYSGNNDDTFNNFNSAQWSATVKELDEVMTEWEKAVETADEKKLEASASTIAHIGTHNAYHIGQILYIRKLQGSWDPANGVK
jgi:uncharacterized damage-inducible protein DinB